MDCIAFPVTLEAFIDCQEAEVGQKLSENEREAVAVINGCYMDGVARDPAAMGKLLDRMEDCLTGREVYETAVGA